MRLRQAKKRRERTEECGLREGFSMLKWKAEEAKMFSLNFSNTVTIREASVNLDNYSVAHTHSKTRYYRIQATIVHYQENVGNAVIQLYRCFFYSVS